MTRIIRWMYDCVMRLSRTQWAVWVLILVSFLGATVFPLPAEVIMIPMILARPNKAFIISTIALVATVLGGLSGYYVGAVLFDTVGVRILALFNYAETFGRFAELYHEWGSMIVFIGGFSPFPYKVITIASGFVKMDVLVFTLASIVARGLRYYLIAWLLWKYGDEARKYIERHLGKITVIVCICLVVGFWVMRYI